MESLLNVFYFGMAIYGWYNWSSGGQKSETLAVSVCPAKTHVMAMGTVAVLVVLVGGWLNQHTDAAFPFVDSATTFLAIWATFLVARKVLENWYYWLVIDIVSIFPLGSLVKLNNGEVGRVVGTSRLHPTRPMVDILIDPAIEEGVLTRN